MRWIVVDQLQDRECRKQAHRGTHREARTPVSLTSILQYRQSQRKPPTDKFKAHSSTAAYGRGDCEFIASTSSRASTTKRYLKS